MRFEVDPYSDPYSDPYGEIIRNYWIAPERKLLAILAAFACMEVVTWAQVSKVNPAEQWPSMADKVQPVERSMQEKLTSMDLQKLYKHLLESGRVDRIEARSKPNGLSVKTVRNINQMISSACNCAVEQRIIATNPTKEGILFSLWMWFTGFKFRKGAPVCNLFIMSERRWPYQKWA